jgi:hypothetical protein
MHAKVCRVATDKFSGCPVFLTGASAADGQVFSFMRKKDPIK